MGSIVFSRISSTCSILLYQAARNRIEEVFRASAMKPRPDATCEQKPNVTFAVTTGRDNLLETLESLKEEIRSLIKERDRLTKEIERVRKKLHKLKDQEHRPN